MQIRDEYFERVHASNLSSLTPPRRRCMLRILVPRCCCTQLHRPNFPRLDPHIKTTSASIDSLYSTHPAPDGTLHYNTAAAFSLYSSRVEAILISETLQRSGPFAPQGLSHALGGALPSTAPKDGQQNATGSSHMRGAVDRRPFAALGFHLNEMLMDALQSVPQRSRSSSISLLHSRLDRPQANTCTRPWLE